MAATKERIRGFVGPGVKSSASGRCPVCNSQNAEFYLMPDPSGSMLHRGWCLACSNVFITPDAIESARQQKKLYLLSHYFRRLPVEEGNRLFLPEDTEKVISSVPAFSLLDQFDLALKTICEMCTMVGEHSTFNWEYDWPLLMIESPRTALFMVRELGAAGYLSADSQGEFFPPTPTWKAYVRLQELQSSGRNSEIGFVAMSFAAEQTPVWLRVIKPGIEKAGYRPFRVDQTEHDRRIDDEIIAGIRRCRFLVADFTKQRNGVYFEAGMALGLGRHVIWMCRHAEKDLLHFDTRQFNHILYDDFEEARKALTNRIVALEGQGNYVSEGD